MRVRVQPSVDLVDGHDEGLVEEERLDALEESHLVRGEGSGLGLGLSGLGSGFSIPLEEVAPPAA